MRKVERSGCRFRRRPLDVQVENRIRAGRSHWWTSTNPNRTTSIFEPSRSPWPSRVLSIYRIIAGVIFVSSGTMKLFNVPAMPPGQPPIELMSQVGIGGLLEVVGGILIVLGLFTRPTAFILSGMMAVAYF